MKTVFFDIDTQIDFLYPAGALYVPGAERIVPAIERLNRYAGTHGITIVSSTDAHAENDPEFQSWPPHCVAGTAGQQKPAATLLSKQLVVPNRPADLNVDGAEQVILEKQQLDLFTNPNIRRLIETLHADRYVVYGVVTEYCVKCAAMGLLDTGKPVSLVTDAIETLKTEAGEGMIREFQAKGGTLTTVNEVCGQSAQSYSPRA
jgi:nicotinamidase/pyrazinamidase